MDVQTNVAPGTNYTTAAKIFAPKTETVDGLTRTTTYTLTEAPANAAGSVQDGIVILNFLMFIVKDICATVQLSQL